MYELVNTSIPNGLLPGTHGYSTVAMTKGLPDALRIRLEAFCAYQHRTNAHDSTYWSENPINWFHVILPQGVHAIGCVAPSEFDYTGRTNRLARMCSFGKDEMPTVGGAAVLRSSLNRFREPWTGEARWLDSDTAVERELQSTRPTQNTIAPAWRRMFGESDGLNLAKQFASLLSDNISAGGRPIYFKTSATNDVEGVKLLELFADLIDMLPLDIRASVTFATYPAALPNGTICHLRGVYDGDRTFEATAATQPWVDCIAATVHNADKLPPIKVRKKEVDEAPTPIQQSTSSTVPVLHDAQVWHDKMGARPSDAYLRSSYLPPPSTGTNRFFFGVLAVVVVLVVVAATAVILWIRSDDRTLIQDKELMEYPIQDVSSQTVTNKMETMKLAEQEKVELEAKAKAAEEIRRKYEQEKECERKKEAQRKRREDEAKAKVAAEEERKRKEAEERERKIKEDAVAFVKATKVLFGRPDAPKHGQSAKYRIFYYLDGDTTLTNGLVMYETQKVLGHRHTSKWLFDGKKFEFDGEDIPENLSLTSKTIKESCCIVWFAEDTAWYVFHDIAPTKWFADFGSRDLRRMCFGECREVCDTWEHLYRKEDWKYRIKVHGQQVDWRENIFTTSNAIDICYRKEIEEKEKNIAIQKGVLEKKTKLHKEKKEKFNKDKGDEEVKGYQNVTNRLAGIKENLKSERRSKEKRDLQKQEKELESEKKRYTTDNAIFKLIDQKKDLEKGETDLKTLTEKISKAEQNLEALKTDSKKTKGIQEMDFSVKIELGAKKGQGK